MILKHYNNFQNIGNYFNFRVQASGALGGMDTNIVEEQKFIVLFQIVEQ